MSSAASSSKLPLPLPPRQRSLTQLESLSAGIVAGAVEGFITYPAEYLKTRAQFSAGKGQVSQGIISILTQTVKSHGITGLYSGCTALVAGNGLKAGVRFMTYDSFKDMMKDDNGKLTPMRTVLAGAAAGTAEAIVAVTPSETIKTKLIQDAARAQPVYTSTLNGTIAICRSEGFGGVYRGVGPTILKQASNSAVRFSAYSALQTVALDFLQPPSGKLNSSTTFGIGAIAGLITVYTTMPLDNVKTRMQSLEARSRYRNSFHCLTSIVRDEGVLRLWGGSTPRLARLMMSGGIVFTVYENLKTVMLSM